MRIVVNTRLLLPGKLDGIGWFTYETLKRITRNHPEHEFIFLFDRKYHPDFVFSDNIKPVILRPPARHPILWFIWFEWSVPVFLKKVKADLFISPDGYLPLRTKVPTVAVIHDINFHHRPQDLPFCTRLYYNYFFPKFARKAKGLATVSNYSKQDIQNNYKVSKGKISVVYNGANELYTPLTKEERKRVKESFTNHHPYFIFIGTLHPRKNIPNLLRGFDLFRLNSLQNYKLVIVGDKMFMTNEIDRIYASMIHKDDVIFSGRLDPEELRRVLGASDALTFVPFYEGFGIPVVEAMRCGVPVLASNVTSVPEVAGDAALYCDPGNVEEIASSMNELASNPSLKDELSKKGLKRAQKFSWDNTAEELWKLIEKTSGDA